MRVNSVGTTETQKPKRASANSHILCRWRCTLSCGSRRTFLCSGACHDDFIAVLSARRDKETWEIPVDLPSFVSALTIRSPLTCKACRLGRVDAKRSIKARVLMRVTQKPWNVSAFSHHVCMTTSNPERPLMLMFSRRLRTVSHWPLWIRNANGMTRLCEMPIKHMMMGGMRTIYLDKSRGLCGHHTPCHCLQQLLKYRQNALARSPHQVNDQVANEQASRLVVGLQLPCD